MHKLWFKVFRWLESAWIVICYEIPKSLSKLYTFLMHIKLNCTMFVSHGRKQLLRIIIELVLFIFSCGIIKRRSFTSVCLCIFISNECASLRREGKSDTFLNVIWNNRFVENWFNQQSERHQYASFENYIWIFTLLRSIQRATQKSVSMNNSAFFPLCDVYHHL